MLWLICAQVFMSFYWRFFVFWYKTRKGLDQIEGISAGRVPRGQAHPARVPLKNP